MIAVFRAVAEQVIVAQQVRQPFPPPPPIFDLLISLVFLWGGWKLWQRGRGWRSGAAVLWLLALGGFYTYSRSF